ncbi:MAG TPA: glycosyltransferase family 4 protein [Pirellulales bacterium]|jgi:glycosyltransferase involved in cell wall biosynthesis
MKIAEVAPLYESVPPKLYGGTERIVSFLTEELVRQGHDVTLFASGDSETAARLVPMAPHSLRLDEKCIDPLAHHILLVEKVSKCAADFDVVHYHIDYLHYPVSRRMHIPQVTTLHGRLDLPDLVPLYNEFRDMPVVSISDNQRTPLPMANWQATIHHGLPPDLLTFHRQPDDYLAFLGRISPEKRADRAIEIAKRVGMPLKIAAKVDDADRKYYETEIEPLLGQAHVEFVGEINESQKNEFLGRARALVFPIDWPEPFGLVMIEAMACGTPVVAFRHGAVPEVIDEGVTGCICDSVDQAVQCLGNLLKWDRQRCREKFEERFTIERAARQYVELFSQLPSRGGTHGRGH